MMRFAKPCIRRPGRGKPRWKAHQVLRNNKGRPQIHYTNLSRCKGSDFQTALEQNREAVETHRPTVATVRGLHSQP